MIWCGITTPKCNSHYAYEKRPEYKWKTMLGFDGREIYYQKRLMVSINKRPTKLVIACTYLLTEKKTTCKEWISLSNYKWFLKVFRIFKRRYNLSTCLYETKYSKMKQIYEKRNANSLFPTFTSCDHTVYFIHLHILLLCLQYFREIT